MAKGDDLEDFGRRGLPLQRLLGLVEQPRVLDGDHGLVGEGLEKMRFVSAERPGFAPRTLIVPIATPSRSSGTTRTLR